MNSFESGPQREKIDVPEGLDRETVMWFMEKYGHLATEIGLDDILAGEGAAAPIAIEEFSRLSKQKPDTIEGKAGALYVLSRVIEHGREAYDKSED